MKPDTAQQLSPVTITLHWIVGLGVIGMLALGIYMAETETWALYPWHKSFGVLILLVVVPRVIWRLKSGWPAPVARFHPLEQRLVRTVQWTLLLATVLMPLSGFLMSSFGGTGVAVFGFDIVPRNPNPENPAMPLAHNAGLASFFHSMHTWVAWILVVTLLLHVSGALKHHLLNRDGTLRRMLGLRV